MTRPVNHMPYWPKPRRQRVGVLPPTVSAMWASYRSRRRGRHR